jgi:mono/diheme cytochrome c family protein
MSLAVASARVLCVVVAGRCPSSPALAQSAVTSAQIESGGKVYQQWCAGCHNERGFATVLLQRLYNGAEPAILDQRRDLDSGTIGYVVRNGISFMPFFRKTEITNADLADLSAYLTSDPEQRNKASK